jgi:hypothetical protein
MPWPSCRSFLRDVRAAGLSEDQHEAIVVSIAADPLQGDEIAGFRTLTTEIARYWRRKGT